MNPQERATALRRHIEHVICTHLHPDQPDSVRIVQRILARTLGSIPLARRRTLINQLITAAFASMYDERDHYLYQRALAALITADQKHSVTDDAAMNAATGLRAAQPSHDFLPLTEAETGAWAELTRTAGQWAAETLAEALGGAR